MGGGGFWGCKGGKERREVDMDVGVLRCCMEG